MNILIVFQLNEASKNSELKKKLSDIGYSVGWLSEGKNYMLPDNTMWKKDSSIAQGISDVKSACSEIEVQLTSCVVVPSTPWAAIPTI
jgi:hypothetical protein